MNSLLLAAADGPMQISVGGGSSAVKLFLLMTALSFAAGALIAITSFTRIIIVMSFLRQALGTPTLPPNQVIVALSLALTAFVMAPTFKKVNAEALSPYLDDQLTAQDAMDKGSAPVLQFLLKQTRPEDLRLFYELAGAERPLMALVEISRTLKHGGRAVIIEDFDSLSSASSANPIATLREWFAKAGLEVSRVRPVDTEAGHLLVAIGRRVARSTAAA